MLEGCYDCNRVSTILIPVNLYTVYGPAGPNKEPEYVEQHVCPACLYKLGEVTND